MGEAWQVTRFGEPGEALELVELPAPPLGAADVRITTAANGLNALDIGMCRGTHPLHPAPPFVLGAEVVGEVIEIGTAVTRFARGDRVVAMSPLAYGNFRRDVVVPELAAHAVPDAISDSEAAALLVDYQAAYIALVRRARVAQGEWVLVTGAAGALGSAAVQIARAHGARVVAAAGSEEKRRTCTELGAEAVVDSRDGALAAHVREATEGHGADVVCDIVGGDTFTRALEAAALEARVLTMGWASGTMPALDAMTLVRRNLAVFGMSWGSSYPEAAPDMVRDVHARVIGLVEAGEVRPLVGQVVAHVDVPQALERIAGGTTLGKSVATW
ncbi:MAG TPA: zinc-binding dehydrogenase [Gaiellaceae bacterium]